MKIVPLSIFLLSSAQGWAVRCCDRFDKELPSDEQALTQRQSNQLQALRHAKNNLRDNSTGTQVATLLAGNQYSVHCLGDQSADALAQAAATKSLKIATPNYNLCQAMYMTTHEDKM